MFNRFSYGAWDGTQHVHNDRHRDVHPPITEASKCREGDAERRARCNDCYREREGQSKAVQHRRQV